MAEKLTSQFRMARKTEVLTPSSVAHSLQHRPAGLPSALGDASAETRGRVLRTSSFKIVYDESGAPQPQSHTRDVMFSTKRDNAVRVAAREVLAAPSVSSCGVALRKSHINVGFERPGELEFRQQTETKASYTEQPLPKLQTAEENKEKLQRLQKSNIDLAFGVDKSCKAWKTDLSEKFAADADRKFACEGRPEAVDGNRNYISGINLGDNRPGESDEYITETKCQFIKPEKFNPSVNYAATRGKELQEHSWDFAMGRDKTTAEWMPAGKEDMSRNALEKFNAAKPMVDPKLGKELRQSSVFLGGHAVEWPTMQRSLSMPGMKPLGRGVYRP
jgi:hypothetical protein